MEKLLLRETEARAYLGDMSRSKFYELMGAGIIPSVKIGRSRRIAWVDLERYVERLRAEQLGANGAQPQPAGNAE